MARHDWFGLERVEAPSVDRGLLETIHPAPYVNALEGLCARGGGFLDADTAAASATFEAALRAAGGAVALADALLGGPERVGVSALRPPGHHAEPSRAMGFCFFGNAALAARRATSAHGLERVLILDWDVHHGNGTEAIFARDSDVLFRVDPRVAAVSGHGSGVVSGRGDGRGLHGQPAGAGRERRRRLPLAGGARGGAAGPCLGAAARARVGGVRRPQRRSAGVVHGDRGGLRGHDGHAARGVRRGRGAAGPGAGGRLRPRRAGRLDGGADAGAGRGVDAGSGRGRAPSARRGGAGPDRAVLARPV